MLKAYSLLDKEVGYCQGLSFVAGLLLIHVRCLDIIIYIIIYIIVYIILHVFSYLFPFASSPSAGRSCRPYNSLVVLYDECLDKHPDY